MKITVATRKSALALAQCRAWIRGLEALHPGLTVAELHVTTEGDRIQDRSLSEVGGKGLFVKEIEQAILDGSADVAVHSMKDLPAELLSGLVIASVPEREDPRDAVITRTGRPLRELPPKSVVGSSSLRRKAQLLSLFPELEVVPLRGNVDTRIKKCESGTVDAVLLAQAGLNRLGRGELTTEVLDSDLFIPAIGQGALAIECRADDSRLRDLLAATQHTETWLCTAAERGVMAYVSGDCKTPVAAYGQKRGAQLFVRGFLSEEDCTRGRRRELTVPWPNSVEAAHEAGQELGRLLRDA
ncbi:MAG: hydroxymethylbilane synthase [Polyangiaceae bacterium]|nr:hydroxymethylbilane synthase [Polyangiaceae bacterium]